MMSQPDYRDGWRRSTGALNPPTRVVRKYNSGGGKSPNHSVPEVHLDEFDVPPLRKEQPYPRIRFVEIHNQVVLLCALHSSILQLKTFSEIPQQTPYQPVSCQ